MKRKIFVTGSGGMVGHYIESVFAGYDLVLTDVSSGYINLDVTDEKATRELMEKHRPDILLHLAAATDVDRCERDALWAHRCNVDGTRNVALACRDTGVMMIYMSSGSVFSGRLHRPARETDEPDPVNVYGKSKLAGENEVKLLLKDYLIVRAGWMLGGGVEKDKKFVGKIMKRILGGDKHLKVINDKFGSPVYAKDLLKGIKVLLDQEMRGIYHMANQNSGRCSRYEIMLAIKEILGLDDFKVEPVTSAAFNLSAPRALSEELENFRLTQMGLGIMRPWREALEDYLLTDWRLEIGCLR